MAQEKRGHQRKNWTSRYHGSISAWARCATGEALAAIGMWPSRHGPRAESALSPLGRGQGPYSAAALDPYPSRWFSSAMSFSAASAMTVPGGKLAEAPAA